MEIFINSTFAQSMLGYRLMRVCNDSFVDVASADELPTSIYEFFNEDLFKAIWCEIAEGNALISPTPTGSYLGIKGFSGVFNNQKNGNVDIAFFANEDEIFMLANIANKILCNYADFSALIFRSICIDDVGNYSIDQQAFLKAIDNLEYGAFPQYVSNTGFTYRTSKDLLHLAVCMGSEERARSRLPGSKIRFLRPICVIDAKEFESFIM